MSNCPYALTHEVENMTHVAKGPYHGPAPIPEEGKWVQAKQITDISAYTPLGALLGCCRCSAVPCRCGHGRGARYVC